MDWRRGSKDEVRALSALSCMSVVGYVQAERAVAVR